MMSRQGVAIALLACFSSHPAWAHGIGAEAKVSGDKVLVSGFHDDGASASGAKVGVFALTGRVVAQGLLDDSGKWSFDLPPDGDYRIEIEADTDHKAMTRLSVSAGSSQKTAKAPVPPPTNIGLSPLFRGWLAVGALSAFALVIAAVLLRGKSFFATIMKG